MRVESEVPRVIGCEQRNKGEEFWIQIRTPGGGIASVRANGAGGGNAYVGEPHPPWIHSIAEGTIVSTLTEKPEHVIPLNGISVIHRT